MLTDLSNDERPPRLPPGASRDVFTGSRIARDLAAKQEVVESAAKYPEKFTLVCPPAGVSFRGVRHLKVNRASHDRQRKRETRNIWYKRDIWRVCLTGNDIVFRFADTFEILNRSVQAATFFA